MAYSKLTDYAVKDGLPSGNSAKIIRGTEIDADFSAIESDLATKATEGYADAAAAAAAATKANINSPAFTGNPTAPTPAPGDNDTSLATTGFVQAALSALPANIPSISGQSGKYLSNDGVNASWAAIPPAIGTGGQTTTGSLTLTSSSAAAITVTPATPGLYVTLPDATTCSKADNLFAVYNAGDYDYGVKDSTGTQLGWVRARTGAMIGLSDSSTAAGVWAYYGLEKTGITASYVNSTLASMGSTIRRIALDANRTCFLFGGGDCYAIVYDASTQTWGSATGVDVGGGINGGFIGVLSATNQVMVVVSVLTQFRVTTLTISGTGVTVNTGTQASTTLAGNYASFGQLIAVGSSFVVSYGRATTTSALRAITVSGTTPTIGAESALIPATATGAALFVSGSVVRAVAAEISGTGLRCTPFTVSGSTLSAGTSAAVSVTAASFRAFLNGNGNIVCHYLNTTHFATIFKLTGTVEAASSVSLGTAPSDVLTYADYGVISASKTLFSGVINNTFFANILTDTNGTASVGTQLSRSIQGNVTPGVPVFNVTGTTAYAAACLTAQSCVFKIDCSGTSPTQLDAVSVLGANTATGSAYFSSSDKYGVKNPRQLYAGTYARTIGSFSDATSFNSVDMVYSQNGISRAVPLPIHSTFANFFGVTGATNSESWINAGFNNSSTGMVIQRVEAAA